MYIPFYIGTPRPDVIKMVWKDEIVGGEGKLMSDIQSHFADVVLVSKDKLTNDFLSIMKDIIKSDQEINYGILHDYVEDILRSATSILFVLPQLNTINPTLPFLREVIDFFSVASSPFAAEKEIKVVIPVDFTLRLQ